MFTFNIVLMNVDKNMVNHRNEVSQSIFNMFSFHSNVCAFVV